SLGSTQNMIWDPFNFPLGNFNPFGNITPELTFGKGVTGAMGPVGQPPSTLSAAAQLSTGGGSSSGSGAAGGGSGAAGGGSGAAGGGSGAAGPALYYAPASYNSKTACGRYPLPPCR